MLKFLIFCVFFSNLASAKIIDKILAVFDDKIITLSDVKRIQSNIGARRDISPFIYEKAEMSHLELVDIRIQSFLIRSKLSEMGYTIDDDQVEAQIKSTEKRLNLNRDNLMSFLQSKNISFEEYFELIREAIEYNIFNGRVIQPLISITDQEIKNEFYKSSKGKTISFKYDIVDFQIAKKYMTSKMISEFVSVLNRYRKNGILPDEFSTMETSNIDGLTEDGLQQKLKKVLGETEELTFSSPTLLGDTYHVFYIKKKEIAESEAFLKQKNMIRGKIFSKIAQEVRSLWYKREANKHYIKYFLQ